MTESSPGRDTAIRSLRRRRRAGVGGTLGTKYAVQSRAEYTGWGRLLFHQLLGIKHAVQSRTKRARRRRRWGGQVGGPPRRGRLTTLRRSWWRSAPSRIGWRRAGPTLGGLCRHAAGRSGGGRGHADSRRG